MPELMLMYRSAMFFARAYCPEALLGMQTRQELYDVGAVDLERETNGTYAPAETTQDLESRILNGKHADKISEVDRDMGKTQDENHTRNINYDPYSEVVQKKYSEKKRAVIMTALEEHSIEFNPAWTGMQLHQTLLDDVPQDTAEAKLEEANEIFKRRQETSPELWESACNNAPVAHPELGLADLDEADRFDVCFLEAIENRNGA